MNIKTETIDKSDIKLFIIYILSTIIVFMVGVYIADYLYTEYNQRNIKTGDIKINTYDNQFNENIQVIFEPSQAYVITQEDTMRLTVLLLEGEIMYNDTLKPFIIVDDRDSCDQIVAGGIIQYANDDDKVLYKHPNCIPETQTIQPLPK
jgi:hypothetical protein